MPSLTVVGHRGMGKNVFVHVEVKNPTVFMENTIASFNSAAECGATLVEFDVQVTADSTPVIFHDDLLHTSDGKSTRISEMTLQEFQQVGATPGKALLKPEPSSGALKPWPATFDPPLPTLEEAFCAVTPEVGFNVEVKFVGSEPSKVGSEEVDRMLRPVLEVVKKCSGERKLFFSSFNPEAAIQLRKRQSSYEVYFLTEGGGTVFEDERMNSVEAAVKFCSENRLAGVVSEVSAIIRDPTSADLVRRSGLKLLTYGDLNNDEATVRLQHSLRVDGVIVDKVPEIVEAAKKWEPTI